MEDILMLRAVVFEEFAFVCQFFNGDTKVGYGCNHPSQLETEVNNGKRIGYCYCFSCPLGIEAEQQDLTAAIQKEIDWDGLCEDGEIDEGEYLLIPTGYETTEEQKQALWNYELYVNRYNKQWLDEHGIPNSIAE